MKTLTRKDTVYSKMPRVPYPNAATRRQIFNRFIDLLLCTALGISAAAIFLLILALA